MGKYFGTDGFRAEAGVGLTSYQAYKIGRFLGHRYKKEGKGARVAIGKDTRRSCYMLEYALASGLASSGADAYMLHVITTPGVSYVTSQGEFDLGIMISASHNPFYDNGIKILNARGEKLDDGAIEEIENYLDGEDTLPFAKGADVGRIIDHAQGRNRYMGYLLSLAKSSFKGLKIGLDLANGGAWMIGKCVFEALGAQVCAINAEPDGVNINDRAGSTHTDALRGLVREKGLDMGFAFDGDADRCIAVDELGNEVNGDVILYILAKEMKRTGELKSGTVVSTVMSNMGLWKSLDDLGIKSVKTNVGDRFVYEEMRRGGNELGGEQSGHIIISKYATTGDGILTAIKVVEAVLESKGTLSQLSRELRVLPQATRSMCVKDKDAVMRDAGVLWAVKVAEKELGDGGRVLLRKSGTEGVIRIMVEAGSEDECNRHIGAIEGSIRKGGFCL